MGRAITYNLISKKGDFSEEDLERIYQVSLKAENSCTWTCENFLINPYAVYPNWEGNSDWDKLNKRYDNLRRGGLSKIEVCKTLVREGFALYFTDENRHRKIHGFTKVGGNELNAMVVVLGLAAISLAVENTSISVHDEGEFLKCPIVIEEGMARPDDRKIDKDISWLLISQWREGYEDLYPKFKKKAKKLYEFKERYESNYHPPRCEWEITTFCRKVNPEDFKDHPEYGAAQIMAGFDGEYYGLTDKDPEAESYRACAFIKKLIPPGLEMEVTPRLGDIGKKSKQNKKDKEET